MSKETPPGGQGGFQDEPSAAHQAPDMRNVRIIIALMYIVSTLLFVVLLVQIFIPYPTYVEGEVAPEYVLAQASITFKSFGQPETPGVELQFDPSATGHSVDMLNRIFATVEAIQQAIPQSPEGLTSERVSSLLRDMPVRLSEKSMQILIAADSSSLFMIKDAALSLTKEAMDRGIRSSDDLTASIQKAREKASMLNMAPQYREVLDEIIGYSIKPSMKLNWEKTAENSETARQPVTVEVKKGQTILKKGETVTAQQAEICRCINIQRKKTNLFILVPLFLVSITVLIALMQYAKAQEAAREW